MYTISFGAVSFRLSTMNRAVICLWLIICRVVFSGAVSPWNDEQRLLENLLDTPGRYDRRVRPVQNATQPADVYVVVGQERIVILNLVGN